MSILELLARAEEPLSLKDLSDQLEIPKSSALMLLRALKEHDFIETDERGRYSVGLRAFETGSSYMRGMSPIRAVTDQLRWLREEYGITAHFAVLDGDDVVYLAKEEPQDFGVRLASFVGARLRAADTAVGKAQLCQLMETEDLNLSESLIAELKKSRDRGYALDDGIVVAGVRCIAAPVIGSAGVCGAIGVSYLAQAPLKMADVTRDVMKAASVASSRLGGRVRRGGAA